MEAMVMTIEELQARQDEIKARLQEIKEEYVDRGTELSNEIRDEWNTLNEERDTIGVQLDEKLAMRSRIEELAADEEKRESGATFQTRKPGMARGEDIYDLTTVRATVSNPDEAHRELRDRAMRSIEQARFPHEGADREQVQGHIERLLDKVQTPEHDPSAMSRRLLQTGSPVYGRAFGKAILGGHLTSEEARALSVTGSSGADGGYAVPYTLDPTIVPTSNGSVNPWRNIARNEQIAGSNEWRGVTAGAVTATRRAEDAEVGDNAPKLAQPKIQAERVDVFIPFSREVGQDWGSLQAEMARLIQDAKDDEEASSFATGDGNTPNAQGVITGATNLVTTAGTAIFAVADVYSVYQELPPRFKPNAHWVANEAVYNAIRQFDTDGGSNMLIPNLQQGTGGVGVPTPGNLDFKLLGRGASEASTLDSAAATTGKKPLVIGDFRYYVIVDRIGLNLEFVPHLFHADNNRPTGQSGLLAIWRNNAEVLHANAFRVLIVR